MKKNLSSTFSKFSKLNHKIKVLDLFKKLSSSKGFTLIELLIVIAILGVLAAGVLLLIDPVQQFARTRDASRKNALGQMARALQAYYTSRATSAGVTTYPPVSATWITTLVNAGEIKQVPSAQAYSVTGTSACTTNAHNNYCYYVNGTSTEAVAYVSMESGAEKSKCASTEGTFFAWSSTDGRSGIICTPAGAQPSAFTFTYF